MSAATFISAQKSRSRPNCECGDPCFYCGRALPRGRHEHDHFPVPFRHGGQETVATCLECHTMKDRRGLIGTLPSSGRIDTGMFAAITKGLAGIPTPISVSYPDGEEKVVVSLWLLSTLTQHDLPDATPAEAWDIALDIDALHDRLIRDIGHASTPEARIFIAQTYAITLDMLDDRLAAA